MVDDHDKNYFFLFFFYCFNFEMDPICSTLRWYIHLRLCGNIGRPSGYRSYRGFFNFNFSSFPLTSVMRIDACLLKLYIKSAIDRINFCNRWFGLYRLFLLKCMPFPNRNRYRVRTGVKWKLTDRAFIHSLRKIMSVNFFALFLDTFFKKKTFFGGLGGGHLGTLLPKISPRAWSFRCKIKIPVTRLTLDLPREKPKPPPQKCTVSHCANGPGWPLWQAYYLLSMAFKTW